MHHKQMPEVENNGNGNGNGRNTWKWVTVGICLPVISWFASGYFSNVQGQFAELKKEQDSRVAVIHGRIDDLDREKIDKSVVAECVKRLDEKIDYLIKLAERSK